MSLLDLQQRSAEIGRIRIGATVKHGSGTRPVKLDAFRFTTNNPRAAQAVADLFGGDVRPWVGGTQTFEIFTTATQMDVMVPPGELALSQHYELWSGGGCQRRCDSQREQLSGGPCLCPADIAERMAAAAKGKACKPTTRVSVILPDLPGLGVWRHETHGYNAAHELGGTAAFLARAREAGTIIPATMRLEQRETKTGTETHKYAVVVLDVQATLRELVTASGQTSLAEALPPAPSGALAIEGPRTSGPEAPSLASGTAAPSSAGDRMGKGKPVPAEDLPADPEKIAAQARAETDLQALERLARHATNLGLRDDMVNDDEGVLMPLWDVLVGRRDELLGGAA